MTRLAAPLAALFLSVAAAAANPACEEDRFEGTPFTACTVDPGAEEIRLFYRTDDGALIGSFSVLADRLAARGRRLELAMNGGMYHPDRRPVGLYVEDGRELAPLVLSDGPGNFGLLPNGVFCLRAGRAEVVESRDFAARAPLCDFATQSGPLMVEDGALHPRFLPDSDSLFIRNGIGVRPDGRVVLAISDAPVNFHRFARLFRDRLGATDALYIDGRVSRLYAPVLGRADIGFPLGPILGVLGPAD
ncbi:MAG: phosphodiester glycosidase family protein [Paracoccaceae bacterium]|nr:phosphodiester glycosidase family protein [Paracoccaceae bacterium]